MPVGKAVLAGADLYTLQARPHIIRNSSSNLHESSVSIKHSTHCNQGNFCIQVELVLFLPSGTAKHYHRACQGNWQKKRLDRQ